MGTKWDKLKVAMVIDDLIARDAAIGLFEEILGLFPNSTIYTYAHKQGGILGPVEQHRIVSTYLSSKIESLEDWKKYQFLVPNAKEQIVIPCSYDLCIKFSRGLAHIVPVCSGVPVFTYFFDTSRLELPKTLLRQKIFNAMIQHLASRAAKEEKSTYFSSSKLMQFYQKNGEDLVIEPGINRKEFKPFPQALIESMGGRTLTLIDTTDLAFSFKLEELVSKLNADEHEYYFIGPDFVHQELKQYGVEEKRMLGQKCAGELTPLFQRARVLLSFAKDSFPEVVLQARSCQTPVAMIEESTNFSEILEVSKAQRMSFDDALIGQDFANDEIPEQRVDQEVWKRSMIQKINKFLVAQSK